MKLQKVLGATSEIWQIFIQDSSSATGAGLTGLTNASGSLTAYFHRDTDTTATAIALVSMTAGTFTSSGFIQIDATNMPGWYQLCPPNAALASGAKSVGIQLKGATNMAPLNIEVQLLAVNVDDAVRMGMTALPNATAGANGGLPLGDANARVDVGKWLGTAVSTPTVAGVPNVNTKTWNDLATVALPLIPATAGRSLVVDAAGLADANAVKVGPTGSGSAQTAKDLGGTLGTAGAGLTAIPVIAHVALVDTVTTATTVTNLTNAPTAGDLTATMKTSVTTAATAATPVAASVSGAVGSVTGNVGGNVVGSVGSIASFGTLVADIATAVWSAVTRVLTAGTNIVLAKGTGLTGLTDLAASSILSDATPFAGASIAAIKAKTDNLTATPADETLIISATNAIMTRLGTPAGASLAADLVEIEGETDDIAAVKAKTDLLPAAPAAVSNIPTAAQNADALIGRNIAGGSDGGRTVKDVLRFNRNKVEIVVITATSGTLNVYAEDDTTIAWSGIVTRAPADAVSAVDPA